MTCVPSNPRFRLLDHIVGWDAEHQDGLVGLGDTGGVRLKDGPDGIAPDTLDPYISPPPLAPGCGPCDWYLATRLAQNSKIKALDGCSNTWRPAWPRGCVPIELQRAVAVAAPDDAADHRCFDKLGSCPNYGDNSHRTRNTAC